MQKKYGYPQPTNFKVDDWKVDLNNAAQKVLVDGMDPLAALEETANDFNMRNAD